MNELDLTGQHISITYPRLLQTDNGLFYDGLGNTVSIGTGSVGPQGPQGIESTGAQGFQGPRGDLGLYGPQGYQGSQGTQGYQGYQGPRGDLGLYGAQGPQGFRGTANWTPLFSGGVTYGANSNTFYKTTGNNEIWDGQVYSAEGYTRGCYMSTRVLTTAGLFNVMVGLNSDPTSDAFFGSIDYAWYCSGYNLYIYENGVYIPGTGTFTSDTVLSITYDGYNIRYWKDGVITRTVARAIGTPLYLDSSFFNVSSIDGLNNCVFGPMGEQGVPGISSLGLIGTTANASGATLLNGVLTLQPATTNFGGVITTSNQSFSGFKTFTDNIAVNTIRLWRGSNNGVTNIGIGLAALNDNTGSQNTIIGYHAAFSLSNISFTTAVGYQALRNVTVGNNNTAFGNEAGMGLTSGFQNTFIGAGAGSTSSQLATAQNSIAIGYNAFTTKNNQVVLGNSSIVETVLNGKIVIDLPSISTTTYDILTRNTTTGIIENVTLSTIRGFQGPQGFRGFQGVQGFQGPRGFQGFQGFQGLQGGQGFQGPQGFQGLRGFQGFQGNSGISAGAVYYFNQSQSSDVSPYKVLTTQPNGVQQIVTTNLAGSEQDALVTQFLTPELGFAVIPGGTQRFHFHYLKQASNDAIETYATIQLADSTGTPIGPVIQTGTSLIGWVDASIPVEVTLDLTLSTIAIDPTNRMIVKIYLINNDSSAHVINWYTEGNQYYAFVMTTVGVIGNQGAQGSQGPIGFQGVQGFQGAQGIQGFQGFQGAQGTQGPQGPTSGGGATPVKLTSQTLNAASWVSDGTYYTYSWNDANVTTTCDVSVTPQPGSYQTASNAQILPYVGVTAGTGTFYSYFPPNADMVVDIVIIQTSVTPVKLTSQTLSATSWSLNGGYYTYSFSNVNITTTCDVSVTPQNTSYLTAYNAQILPYIDVTTGIATFYAQFLPEADMIVDILIIQTA